MGRHLAKLKTCSKKNHVVDMVLVATECLELFTITAEPVSRWYSFHISTLEMIPPVTFFTHVHHLIVRIWSTANAVCWDNNIGQVVSLS
jgi:hypothetical protein